jgi:predicted O-linked N-acetylglucosamine transferase (SPINDLY family)
MTSVPEIFSSAFQHHQAGHLHEAEQLYRQVLESDPDHADSWHLLGEIAIRRGQYDRAIECIAYAIHLNGGFAPFHNNLGVAYEARGGRDEAVSCYRRALQLQPDYLDAQNNLHNLLAKQGQRVTAPQVSGAGESQGTLAVSYNSQGLALARQGQFEQAAVSFQNAIREDPTYAKAYHNLGCAMCDLGKFSEAESYFRQCLELAPADAQTLCNLGIALTKAGKPAEAESYFQEALRIHADYAGAHNAWGFTLIALGKADDALVHYQRAVELDPNSAEAHYNLGNTLLSQGKCRGAASAFQEALRLNPQSATAHHSLGAALAKLGETSQALIHCQRAIQLDPHYAPAYCNLGCVLQMQARLEEARNVYLQALRLNPDFADVHNNLGTTLLKLGNPAQARLSYQRALEVDPKNAEIWSNLGTAFLDEGKLDEARHTFVEALRLEPGRVGARNNYLAVLNYLPGFDPDFVFNEHCRLGPPLDTPTEVAVVPIRHHQPSEPLRIGYVSPDLWGSVVASFFEPILRHHDPARVQVYAYAEVTKSDETTARLRAMCAGWRSTCGFTDEEVAEQVRDDGIDILIDLAGHVAGNRLGVFARKPAPVQVTYLGYCNTTGLKTIDYRLTDAMADPPGEPVRHSEELFRLPTVFCCFLPSSKSPAVTPSPVLANGWITFGSLHKPAKLNGTVLDMWTRVLRAIPSARLLVCYHTLVDETKSRFVYDLEARGAALERIEFRRIPTPDGNNPTHLPLYSEIDISLDPFPWCGHATACESLWMGVPVIALRGHAHAGRMVASVLSSVGLHDWIADTPDEYLELATRWAAQRDRLAELRMRLRGMMQASPFCDGASFTRGLEAAYRAMWERARSNSKAAR